MKLAPSLLAADLAMLAEQVRLLEGVVAYFHLDVMDGHFVPNLTYGPPVANALRRHTRVPFDIHLMISRPAQYAPAFEVGSEDVITFHVEADDSPEQTIRAIGELGCRIGISLRPGTPLEEIVPFLDRVDLVLVMSVEPGFGGQGFMPEALARIRTLRRLAEGRAVTIAVDGGIGPSNVREVVVAGGELIVAGSSVFGQPDPHRAALELLEAGGCTRV